jgi:hypothetical protein
MTTTESLAKISTHFVKIGLPPVFEIIGAKFCFVPDESQEYVGHIFGGTITGFAMEEGHISLMTSTSGDKFFSHGNSDLTFIGEETWKYRIWLGSEKGQKEVIGHIFFRP